MDLQCYLDWCPVSTLPIDNVTIADYGQTRRRAKRAGIIDPLFTRSPELQSYEYTVRSDGLMLLRLGFDDSAAQELRILVRDDNNGWLRGLYAVTDPMDQSSEPPRPERAMLKLRRHFAIKKDQVIQSLYRERTRAASLSWISSPHRRKPKQEQSKAAPKAWENSLLSFVGLLLLLRWPLEGWLPASTVALIVSFGIFVLTDLTERASKLEMLQRAIGYFAYANVYFRLMDNLYESPKDTGGLEDARHMLEANYLIEKDVIHKRRITLWMLFTIVTLSAALIKAYSLSA